MTTVRSDPRRTRHRPAGVVPVLVLHLLLLLLLVPAQAAAATAAGRPALPLGVIDPLVEALLDSTAASRSVELLVRFGGPIRPQDLAFVEAAGFEALDAGRVLPLLLIRGPVGSIPLLSQIPGVRWIERNLPGQLHLASSVDTISAREAWRRIVLDGSGSRRPSIDGKGVTVAVVDSGIDASHPDLEYGVKVIKNLKRDTQAGIWRERVDTDTSSGHGTHVAGTVAGDGQASGIQKRGVAPSASLIGLSMGEALFTIDEYHALEWVYEHSRPGANPDNIRVVSNSWGPGTSDSLDPADAIVQLIEKITYENNVVVVFAAGNAGGDGSQDMVNPYAKVPASIGVAAFTHDGRGLAGFSSRGDAGRNETWADLGAPGVAISSPAARRTFISALAAKQDPYYLSISGTSMATPHVSGAVALLFQAAPSLRTSAVADDSTTTDHAYWNASTSRMHEAELLLKLTADYVNGTADNGIPGNATPGLAGRPFDFGQGYGLMNVSRAVAVALTLEHLRSTDANATVWQALDSAAGIRLNGTRSGTGRLAHGWHAEWLRFNDKDVPVVTADQKHQVWLPGNASALTVRLQYDAVSLQQLSGGSLAVTIDADGDGTADWSQDTAYDPDGTKEDELDLTGSGPLGGMAGAAWSFEVIGQVVGVPLPIPPGTQFLEARVDYTVALLLDFANATGPVAVDVGPDPRLWGQWDFEPAGNTTLLLPTEFYDLRGSVAPPPGQGPVARPGPQWWLLLVLLIAIPIAAAVRYRKPILRASRLDRPVADLRRAIDTRLAPHLTRTDRTRTDRVGRRPPRDG